MLIGSQRTNRLVPLMAQTRCRQYLLSTYVARAAAKFSNSEIELIQTDLQKALACLHDNKFAHGNIAEDYILIEKVLNTFHVDTF